MPQTEIDLLDIANEVKDNLSKTASAKNISIRVSGKNVVIEGVKRLIYEIIFNLCDNAIKYNKDGGKVDISVSETESNSIVKVKDNGIGIAPEEQNHIFERFYRVDKSHSKASGGTGLGLSIVKHAVQYHNGTVTIDSQIGKGTEITIAIPKNK